MEGDRFLTQDGQPLPLPGPSGAVRPGKATYGIRPEHVTIAEGGVPLRVEVVEPTGSEVMVAARLGEQPISCLFRERLALQPGEVIPVRFDPRTAHLFDGDSGARMATAR